jgi:hypothetical protein
VFGETRYAAKSWKAHKRRVLIKAEVVRQEGKTPKDNARFNARCIVMQSLVP